jgi:hypothetical protein
MSVPYDDAFHGSVTRYAGVSVQRAVMVRQSQRIRVTTIACRHAFQRRLSHQQNTGSRLELVMCSEIFVSRFLHCIWDLSFWTFPQVQERTLKNALFFIGHISRSVGYEV